MDMKHGPSKKYPARIKATEMFIDALSALEKERIMLAFLIQAETDSSLINEIGKGRQHFSILKWEEWKLNIKLQKLRLYNRNVLEAGNEEKMLDGMATENVNVVREILITEDRRAQSSTLIEKRC